MSVQFWNLSCATCLIKIGPNVFLVVESAQDPWPRP
jgi:hypothetical protein